MVSPLARVLPLDAYVVLKARQLLVSDSAFCTGFSFSWLKVAEQALDGIPVGLGMAIKIIKNHIYSGCQSSTVHGTVGHSVLHLLVS